LLDNDDLKRYHQTQQKIVLQVALLVLFIMKADSKQPAVFVFWVEEFVSDGFEFAGVYCSSVELITLALTDVTAPDVKNEFFMGQKAVCR
jgi:hypothetical protein